MGIPVEKCPANVEVEIDQNSIAAKFFKKWPRGYAISHGKIICPALLRKVKILARRFDDREIRLGCVELNEGKCNFQAESSPSYLHRFY